MWQILLAIVVVLFSIFYLRVKKKFSYFKSHGIVEDQGSFPLGSNSSWKVLTGELAFTYAAAEPYVKFPNEKLVGWYGPFGTPILIIRDLQIAKSVLIKDFDHFVDRRPFDLSKKANRYFTDMLTVLTGDKWKKMRAILSPVFSSGKLKSMMPHLNEVGDEFVKHLVDYADSDKMFEAKELMTSYTLDVIAKAGIGINSNSFVDPNNELMINVKKSMGGGGSLVSVMKILLIFMFPKISKLLDISFIDQDAMEFFASVIRKSVEMRKTNKVKKSDFIDILIETMKNHEKSMAVTTADDDQFDADAKLSEKVSLTSFTDEEIEAALISNVLLLFVAGFDTSSTGMAIVMYFLTVNPLVQEKLSEEIAEAISANGGNECLDYNTLQELPYLDQVVHESLRLYPLISLERLCVKDYKIPDYDFVVPKGMLVQVPSVMMMKDELFFPNPEVFDPENFSPERKAERGLYPYMAFGHGPRNCIGMRFALLQLKSAIARLLANYKLVPCSKTVDKLDPDPRSRQFQPKGGIWMKVQKRQRTD